jgi:predicted RNase H-like nuclease
MKLTGIDGCSAGWLVASADSSSLVATFGVHRSIDAALVDEALYEGITVIDIPIGLMDHDRRTCDTLARAFCRPRHNSVFSAPCRSTLAASTYELACRPNFQAGGKSITKQLFGILPKIREVDAAMSPNLQVCVREAHPEVSFAAIGGAGKGMAHSKKTVEGEAERLALLAPFFGPIDPGQIRYRLGSSRIERDDIVDALACLATANRISRSMHLALTRGQAPMDSRGLKMEIVA